MDSPPERVQPEHSVPSSSQPKGGSGYFFKFRLFKEPRITRITQITQITQMKPVLYVMIPGRYYTDSVQHASQVLTDKLAERHSKAA